MKNRDSRIRAAGEDMPAALAQALHERDMAVACINKALRAGEMLCSAGRATGARRTRAGGGSRGQKRSGRDG